MSNTDKEIIQEIVEQIDEVLRRFDVEFDICREGEVELTPGHLHFSAYINGESYVAKGTSNETFLREQRALAAAAIAKEEGT